ncbi:hypothetical protein Bca52824_011367 [Brassica carinata]|uniref:Uncharacterized protein n=1 Tax=Brassica carinata TaxID=52824 RepID=A0A8X7WF79_BRACI|nr:hypothetical protein Bca52824_011367 [Brassica carinata]
MVVYEGSTCETKPDKEVEEPDGAAKPDKGAARTGVRHRPKVMAVKGGITRTDKLAKMREAKNKAQATHKNRGRPKKNATLKPCRPLQEKRKGEPARWVQSPFTEEKTDELEVPKKKLKTKA